MGQRANVKVVNLEYYLDGYNKPIKEILQFGLYIFLNDFVKYYALYLKRQEPRFMTHIKVYRVRSKKMLLEGKIAWLQ
jgi:hypothetical protein|tara:strand:- start:189 stop:422 length:234 start_codon:yes stop_codon:yes gene_type:complete